jgi:hypothetical protein
MKRKVLVTLRVRSRGYDRLGFRREGQSFALDL